MKKTTLITLIIIIILLIGGGFLIVQKASAPAENLGSEAVNIDTKPQVTELNEKNIQTSTNNTSAERYVQYSKSVLDDSSEFRRVLFFYASWCPTCIPADASFISDSSKIPDDVIVIRVNYNDPDTDQEEKDLAGKYGVVYQHTFVQIDGNGQVVTKWNGGQIDDLVLNIK